MNCTVGEVVVVKKVQFNLIPTIHHLIVYKFAYQESRKGKWEQSARDRIRFQIRIKLIESVISPILVKHQKIVAIKRNKLLHNII